MFKKKEEFVKPPRNAADVQYRVKWYETLQNYNLLRIRVENVIAAMGAIDMWYTHVDREEAIKHAEKVKRTMYDTAKAYDNNIVELRSLFSKHHNELSECADWDPDYWSDPHTVVRTAYRDFFQKKY